jgi:hypothetical protein
MVLQETRLAARRPTVPILEYRYAPIMERKPMPLYMIVYICRLLLVGCERLLSIRAVRDDKPSPMKR